MNTPSTEILRKAIKIVDEIEGLDQQIHHLLGKISINGERRTPAPSASQRSKKKKEQVFPEEVTSPILLEHHEDVLELPPVPQQEEQPLLMEDTGIEQLAIVEIKPSESNEESSDQQCCLF
jgi:hypothetical protein